jgi:hypothetical protein
LGSPTRWDVSLKKVTALGVLCQVKTAPNDAYVDARFTRLTNGFSKKVENHAAAVAVYFMYYNFVRVHQTLRMTPAMAAGVTAKLWEVSDMVGLLEAKERNDQTAA